WGKPIQGLCCQAFLISEPRGKQIKLTTNDGIEPFILFTFYISAIPGGMSLGSVYLRPVQRLPEHVEGENTVSTDPDHQVEFKHPAYPDECDTFLTLAALDHPDGGIHYNTARIACGVITGNRWEGSFTAEKNGQSISLNGDDILPPGIWYFYLPGYQYGTLLSFSYHQRRAQTLTSFNRFHRYLVSYHPPLLRMEVSAQQPTPKLAPPTERQSA
ncbi:MAG: hypothetical protein Q9196_007321, partial [Gyalolechia fulgens]